MNLDEMYKLNDIVNSRKFLTEVKKLSEKYNLSFFIVTEGASMYNNHGCEAVRNARDCHIQWEKKNGHNPYAQWDEKTLKGDGI